MADTTRNPTGSGPGTRRSARLEASQVSADPLGEDLSHNSAPAAPVSEEVESEEDDDDVDELRSMVRQLQADLAALRAATIPPAPRNTSENPPCAISNASLGRNRDAPLQTTESLPTHSLRNTVYQPPEPVRLGSETVVKE